MTTTTTTTTGLSSSSPPAQSVPSPTTTSVVPAPPLPCNATNVYPIVKDGAIFSALEGLFEDQAATTSTTDKVGGRRVSKRALKKQRKLEGDRTAGGGVIVKVCHGSADLETVAKAVGDGAGADGGRMVLRMTESTMDALRDLGVGHGGAGGCMVVTTLDVPLANKKKGVSMGNVRGGGAGTGYAAGCARSAKMGGLTLLTDGALQVLTVPNAGGDSVLSEALSAEMLLTAVWPEMAKSKTGSTTKAGLGFLAATEMAIQYFPQGGAMLDYVVGVTTSTARFRRIGVSVTRAFSAKAIKKGGQIQKFKLDDATRILTKKLEGIQYAARNIFVPARGMDALVLHIFVPDGNAAKLLRKAYRRLPLDVCGRTVVLVTVCNAACIFEKTNRHLFNNN
ncbi:hypothetical protein HDU97_002968 [Phlyctochytrium planicorne]|nr:hypothetical protein HDU97_002968 [Phlyctochytrium planicorne]